jgi:hypothetical protein
MDFYDILDEVIHLFRSRGRLAYHVLKRQFDLDDEDIEALKDEPIYKLCKGVGRRALWPRSWRVLETRGNTPIVSGLAGRRVVER